MNAFPAELIQHHYACMLVAGLLPSQQAPFHAPPTQQAATATEQAAKTAPPTDGHEGKVESGPAAVSTEQSYVPSSAPQQPVAGPSQPKATTGKGSAAATPAETFPQLAKDLCEIFTSRGRGTAWDPARSKSAVFHSILVDHNVRLPPRKTRPTPRTLAVTPAGQQSLAATLPPRSPLSPLHPSSPLFPDGLIAPIWLRKHRDLVPSVFVAFYCLSEQSNTPPPTPPKDGERPRSPAEDEKVGEQDGRARSSSSAGWTGEELKAQDEALIKMISDRKRSLSERGIKYTVVLLAKRSMLESPTLEQRLSFIRRSSQLDSRASLFVLTPVSRAELGEFVTSLQVALYESALDYYREQFRRVRRKRTRYPPPPSIVSQIYTAAAEIRGNPIKDNPLSKEGWMTRNEYKLGAFSELIGNLDDALSHYINAYQLLATQLLTSTLLLPPRTKRWAEAKVLADTLSFRIAKLHLYKNDGEAAWEQFRSHIRKFTELSQGWGIGEMTFEFWSWLGKQYRLMGDLLDLAMREVPGITLAPFQPSMHFPPMPTFLLHPSHLPTPTVNGNVTASYNPQHGNLSVPNDAAMNSHVVPAELCPGAGECFYIAGICALERWERFRRLQWEEQQLKRSSVTGEVSTDSQGSTADNWSSLSLAQERKIDHAAQAIESLGRAHELFKRQKRQRLSLFVASKIANAYVESNQNELALRFLERTAKSYEAEGWLEPFGSQLLLAVQCAQVTADAESEGRALWMLLGAVALEEPQRKAALESLQLWLAQKTIKEEKRPLQLHWRKDKGPLVVRTQFIRNRVDLDGSAVSFQVQISAQAWGGLGDIEFDRLRIILHDEEGDLNLLINNTNDTSKASSIVQLQALDMRSANHDPEHQAASAHLQWQNGQSRVYEGSIIPRRLGLLQVAKVTLERDGDAPCKLEIDAVESTGNIRQELVQPVWFINTHPLRTLSLPFQEDRGGLEVSRQNYKAVITVQHEKAAFLDESFPLQISVRNDDSVALDCQLDIHVLGLPGEVISSDEISLTDQSKGEKLSSLRDATLERVEPGMTAVKRVYVTCRRHLSTRTVDVVLRSKAVDGSKHGHESEIVHSVAVPVKHLLSSNFYAQWRLLRDTKAIAAARRASHTDTPSPLIGSLSDEGGLEDVTALSIVSDELPFVTAIASLNVSLNILAQVEIELVSINLVLDTESKHLQLWEHPGKLVGEKRQERAKKVLVDGLWAQGDRWGGVFDVELLCESAAGMAIEAEDASVRPTGRLEIEWRRSRTGSGHEDDGLAESAVNSTSLTLPLLLPPHLLARLIVSLPSSISFEQPLVMLVTIVNPSRLAADIVISIDDARSDFGVQSHRTFTVPNLLPRSTRSVPVHLAPRANVRRTAQASIRTLPNVRAWQRDRRQSSEAATQSARTSFDSAGPGGSTSVAATAVAGHRREELLQIVNQRPGAGVPLDVSLRYTSRNLGPASAPPKAMPRDDANAPASDAQSVRADTTDKEKLESSQTNAPPTDLGAYLQAETQRTGLWTILVQ